MTPIQVFMAGFTFAFIMGLFAWGAGFVRAIIGGGHNE